MKINLKISPDNIATFSISRLQREISRGKDDKNIKLTGWHRFLEIICCLPGISFNSLNNKIAEITALHDALHAPSDPNSSDNQLISKIEIFSRIRDMSRDDKGKVQFDFSVNNNDKNTSTTKEKTLDFKIDEMLIFQHVTTTKDANFYDLFNKDRIVIAEGTIRELKEKLNSLVPNAPSITQSKNESPKKKYEPEKTIAKLEALQANLNNTDVSKKSHVLPPIANIPHSQNELNQMAVFIPSGEVPAGLNGIKSHANNVIPINQIESADKWIKIGEQMSANSGGTYKDHSGQEWYVKTGREPDFFKNEVLAAKLYAAAGIAVPELKHVIMDDKLSIASKIVPNLQSNDKNEKALCSGKIKSIYDGFAVDAWLANWDVVGMWYDNLQINKQNEAIRIDVGGSLLFRGAGEPKGNRFGPAVTELKNFISDINPIAKQVFRNIKKNDIKKSAQRVANVADETIYDLCEQYGPGEKEQRTALAKLLIARKKDLMKSVGV